MDISDPTFVTTDEPFASIRAAAHTFARLNTWRANQAG